VASVLPQTCNVPVQERVRFERASSQARRRRAPGRRDPLPLPHPAFRGRRGFSSQCACEFPYREAAPARWRSRRTKSRRSETEAPSPAIHTWAGGRRWSGRCQARDRHGETCVRTVGAVLPWTIASQAPGTRSPRGSPGARRDRPLRTVAGGRAGELRVINRTRSPVFHIRGFSVIVAFGLGASSANGGVSYPSASFRTRHAVVVPSVPRACLRWPCSRGVGGALYPQSAIAGVMPTRGLFCCWIFAGKRC